MVKQLPQSPVWKSMTIRRRRRRRTSHCFPQLTLTQMIFRRIHRDRLYRLYPPSTRSPRLHLCFHARVTFRRTQSGLLCGSSSPLFVKWSHCRHINCLSSPQIPALTLMKCKLLTTQKMPSALTPQPYNLRATRMMMQMMRRSSLFLVKNRHPFKSHMNHFQSRLMLNLLPFYAPIRLPAIR